MDVDDVLALVDVEDGALPRGTGRDLFRQSFDVGRGSIVGAEARNVPRLVALEASLFVNGSLCAIARGVIAVAVGALGGSLRLGAGRPARVGR